jgi:hypothetical protein
MAAMLALQPVAAPDLDQRHIAGSDITHWVQPPSQLRNFTANRGFLPLSDSG